MFLAKAMRHWKTLPNLELLQKNWHLKIVTVSGISAVLGVMNNQMSNAPHRYYNSLSTPKPPPNPSAENIVWVDTELTGLDPNKDHVLEIACLVTDGQLNILAEGPDLIIHHPPEVLGAMDEWSTKQHQESGLTSKCRISEISLKEAERQLLGFVREWIPFNKCPLGGNTVYMDRLFLMKHMPDFEKHMHYRIIDVSSVKELCSRWYPEIYAQQPNKKELSKHRALADIMMSIEELKFYRERIFRRNGSSEAVNAQLQWC